MRGLSSNTSALIIFAISVLLYSCKQEKTDEKSLESNELPLFNLVRPEESGIHFRNTIAENYDNFFAIFNYVYNGAGVAVADINNDGLSDIYFTANEAPDRIYLNKGNLNFEDITDSANLTKQDGWHNGVVMADVNADGLTDIYICRGGWQDTPQERSNLLYINQGDNTFKESATDYGLADEGFSVMASFFDMDNDNDLDLYLTNRPEHFFLNYQQVLAGKTNENDLYRDKLYINNNGKFEEVSKQNGITGNFGYGLGLVTSDVDKDGQVDLFVANDYLERDYLYMNHGKGNFSEQLKSRFNHIPFYAMGVDIADLDNDGWEDIVQLEMMPEDYERSKTTMADMNTQLFNSMKNNGFHYQYMHNMLQKNRGDGFFSDVSQYSGIAKTDWSWACLASDFDNDGLRDIFITNGFKRDIWDKDATIKFRQYMESRDASQRTKEENAQHIISLFKQNKISNYLYKNEGDLKFTNMSKAWGLDQQSFSNGAATADLDNDGDLDLIVNNVDDPAFLYENLSNTTENGFLKINLKGPANNKDGLGTKITLKTNDSIQFHEFKTVRGYLSSVEPIVHFGLGKISKIDSISIVWPDGKEHLIQNVASNSNLIIDYKEAKQPVAKSITKQTLFKDVTNTSFSSAYEHQENEFDDFKIQVLLPHKLSTEGPGIAVGDINNDGLGDFYVGGASGSPGALYQQTASGSFVKKDHPILLTDAKYEDVDAVFFDVDNDQDLDLYVVSGGNEFSQNSPLLKDRLYLNNGKGLFTEKREMMISAESGGCVLPFDIDNDGDLDLFIGGRLIPGQYPKAPKSLILLNDNGNFNDVTKEMAPELEHIGMVTDATYADIDGDNTKELIIVGEWMPITIFKANNGKLQNNTTSYGLGKTNGWYNCITVADLDQDGIDELIVGNLGLNYKFTASDKKPFKVFASDFDQNGTNDIFLAKDYKGRQVPVRGLQCSSEQLPGLDRKFKTFTQFSKSNLRQIIGEGIDNALQLNAYEFASVIIKFNDGNAKLTPLPYPAQFSSINGFVTGDFNADGVTDIALAGNKFESEIETTRADASIGLILLGTKEGHFTPQNRLTSGFFAPKNVKVLKSINLANGKTGLLVGNNDDEIQLFKN
ncbi:VCBS repeat-containing protein [uncultured Maribacter sp.]|uniref:VCBS repeat-containing protein n=1 Tax=uncultured Maribacter sp. TaxID=431308 RepID=UPI002629E9D6|nr:VCBS repeat-containing protein [uncultured Maribacter sp.]